MSVYACLLILPALIDISFVPSCRRKITESKKHLELAQAHFRGVQSDSYMVVQWKVWCTGQWRVIRQDIEMVTGQN